MNFVWQWPQLVWLGCACASLAITLVKNGETVTLSFGWRVVAFAISAVILYYGGFFTEGRP